MMIAKGFVCRKFSLRRRDKPISLPDKMHPADREAAAFLKERPKQLAVKGSICANHLAKGICFERIMATQGGVTPGDHQKIFPGFLCRGEQVCGYLPVYFLSLFRRKAARIRENEEQRGCLPKTIPQTVS